MGVEVRMRLDMPIHVVPPAAERALKYSMLWQGVTLLLTGILLDGGRLGVAAMIASVGYWAAVGVILIRRRRRLTGVDLEIFRWGYAGCLIVACVAAMAVRAF